MITLIAESKTMRNNCKEVTHENYINHNPSGEKAADKIMHMISHMSLQDIAAKVKVSGTMASKIMNFSYDFPNKRTGLNSIEAFTGVVFKTFDYGSLSESEKYKTRKYVRIISSLYGWLRPEDIIKPYRLEFNSHIAPNDKTLAEFWCKDVTIQLVREIKQNGATDILNLMPEDAARCIDLKLVKRYAEIWKIDFKELQDGGEYKTPNSNRLKQLRGMLLREIVKNEISSPSELKTFSSETFLPLGTPDYPNHIAFCV